ncbi:MULTISPECIES: ornithine carbamoyltransferase [Aneurinibacillus]|uniref:Ornithine carbamoyltransferase n=1 Tax=Aneurinibacillus thermoaerophilus TaxID=143495 RepID=A0A1G8EFS6_ANETH|nr:MULTISPECIES: ornithine carbamoyltransferase [Aneurinibacillus]AMA71761.1 ornithine carbamoyltransferase [Aneurinibacillus sp. XH2]MED0674217.1 ornithine carbamoyltransferase [Aneurinibacillus thermoaerophilus]MED0678231.1 ornithine carbamoyltransferase [Aneurinibacillus thermoaerophilus]MED0735637.1 ornithine carbamoyltransferase [Aneurinibacillus thermoaerophilus]MED0757547.1 ornithine carbamoyltransferase [Aneurinibacillus thermoaerophilus]
MVVTEQLKGKDFLCLSDYTKDEIMYLLDLAAKLKSEQKQGIPHPHLAGKTLGMIFDKASTRTRVSFEVGMYQLGGMAMFMSGRDLQIGRGEPIPDTARVLSRYLDGIMIRTYSDAMVKELADYASIPIINGLTDMQHPCQVMADFQTIIEHKGGLEGLKLAYVGDGNNMVHSLMIGAAKVGMNVAVASPEGYMPDAGVTEMTYTFAEESGAQVLITNDPEEAVADADIVYTDVWASMGQEAEQQERLMKFKGFEVNETLMKKAKSDAIFMHCLPAHRGEEVAAEVIDGPQSVVFDQSENRLHAQKAILVALMK